MAPFVLVWRLAAYDLRRRLTQSVLLLLVIAAATSTQALAFALDGTSNTPWSTTRAATAGPDICSAIRLTQQNCERTGPRRHNTVDNALDT